MSDLPEPPELPEPPPPPEEVPGAWGGRPDFVNEFSWSPSRARLFDGCKRAYYWRYYAHWGGWDAEAPAEARIAYRLGKLDTMDTWAGTIVHDLIEAALKKARWGRPIRLDELRMQARARLRIGWVQSRDGHWVREPKRALNLFAHYYGEAEGLRRERTDAIAARVYEALRAFAEGPFPALAARLERGAWRSIEGLDSIRIAGQTVYVKPDLAFDHPDDGTTWLVDWKTGAPSDKDAFQVATYALFARGKWGVAADKTTGVLVYLARGEERAVPVTDAALDDAEAAITASMARMRQLLTDADGNVADRVDFPMTADRDECAWCSFRQLCFGAEGVPGAAVAADPALPAAGG